MNHPINAVLLFYYGVFLIICGIVSVVLIGKKAKTALISGGTSGIIAIVIGHFIWIGSHAAVFAGMFISFALLIVFSWRSTKTLFTIFELIRPGDEQLKGKGIAFLIISMMAVVSIFVLFLQLIHY